MLARWWATSREGTRPVVGTKRSVEKKKGRKDRALLSSVRPRRKKKKRNEYEIKGRRRGNGGGRGEIEGDGMCSEK